MTPATSARQETLPERISHSLTELAFVIFIVLFCIGLDSPALFGAASNTLTISQSGSGNATKQAIYILMSVLILATGFIRRDRLGNAKIPITILVVLAWAWSSLLWSAFPDIAFRRLTLLSLIIYMVFGFVKILGSKKALKMMAVTLAVILVGNLLSVASLPGAIQTYQPFDQVSESLDTWRGLHTDKNSAGIVGAFQVYIFISIIFRRDTTPIARVAWLTLCLMAVCFMFGSGSKTAIGLLLPVGLASIGLIMISGRRSSAIAIILVSIVTLCILVLVNTDILRGLTRQLSELLGNPRALTGRVEIWLMVSRFINDNFWLGAGYGSFFQVGLGGPVFRYATGWLLILPNAHNGYLDIMVQLGVVGLILSAFAVISVPFFKSLAYGKISTSTRWFIMSIIIFFALNNMLEATYFNRDSPGWVLFLFAIALLSTGRRQEVGRTNKRLSFGFTRNTSSGRKDS